MRWFIVALTKYRDFEGRARRIGSGSLSGEKQVHPRGIAVCFLNENCATPYRHVYGPTIRECREYNHARSSAVPSDGTIGYSARRI